MAKSDWDIPTNLRPEPDDYRFDLARALRSVVGVRASVPQDAFTAGALGTERIGNGTVIRDDGLVLTIGYLITEAEMVWLISADGAAVPGHALAYDQATGFGLVQALGRLNLPALEFGDSARLGLGEAVILAAGGGADRAIEAKVIGRQEFAGYWEYVLDEAIYTAPAHPFWSGSALIGTDGRLLGVGSLDPAAGRRARAAARHEHDRADRAVAADPRRSAHDRARQRAAAPVARRLCHGQRRGADGGRARQRQPGGAGGIAPGRPDRRLRGGGGQRPRDAVAPAMGFGACGHAGEASAWRARAARFRCASPPPTARASCAARACTDPRRAVARATQPATPPPCYTSALLHLDTAGRGRVSCSRRHERW